jgi:outer membrane protein assembly factor BamB
MAQTQPRSRRLWLLVGSVILFLLFGLLMVYEKYHDAWSAYLTEKNDVTLLEELTAATILDDPEPLAGGWPQWRGPGRDGVAFDRNLQLDWKESGPETLWTINGGFGYSTFAVFGGRAFTMLGTLDKEIVVCLDMDHEGQRIWSYDYPCTFQNKFGEGPRATPALDREPRQALSMAVGPYTRATTLLPGDRLYTVGGDGKFHCLDAVTGEVRWKKELLDEFHAENLQWGVSFSPLIESDLVITNPGGPNASIVAFDKYSGAVRWATQSDKAGYSSPMAVDAAGHRQILVFGGKALLSVAPEDGHLYWRHPWDVNSDVNAATPIVFHAQTKAGQPLDYVFITSGYAKGCALLKMGTDAAGQPNVNVVYSGKKKSEQLSCHFSSPVRRGDYLYGFHESTLRCYNLKTGATQWDMEGFHKGSLLRVDDRLLVLGEKGELAVVAATPDAKPEKLSEAEPFSVRDGRRRCWAMPVLADGRLLLRDEKQIVCLDLRKHE